MTAATTDMLYLVAALLLTASVAAKAWRQRRKMLRRSIAGVEQFKSYTSFVVNRNLDGLLFALSKVLFFAGVIGLSAAVFEPVEAMLYEVFRQAITLLL